MIVVCTFGGTDYTLSMYVFLLFSWTYKGLRIRFELKKDWKQLTFVITVCCLAISYRLVGENSRTEKFSQTASSSHTATDGHFNKTFTSVIYKGSYCSRVDLKTVAILVNYPCKSLIELTPRILNFLVPGCSPGSNSLHRECPVALCNKIVALCNELEMDGRRTSKPNNKYHNRQQQQ